MQRFIITLDAELEDEYIPAEDPEFWSDLLVHAGYERINRATATRVPVLEEAE